MPDAVKYAGADALGRFREIADGRYAASAHSHALSALENDAGFQTASQVAQAVAQAVASVYRACGSCERSELPASPSVGDVWNLTDEDGMNVVWNGTSWDALGAAVSLAWSAIEGKPSTFAPSAHTHQQADVSGLADALAGKAAASHSHTVSQVADFPDSMPASDVYAWAKAASKPTYTASEVGAAPSSHSHALATASSPGMMSAADYAKLSNITVDSAGNVQTGIVVDAELSTTSANPVQNQAVATALNGKAAASHTHDYLPLSGGDMQGPIDFDAQSLPQVDGTANYFVCIDAFADGGRMRWTPKDNVLTSIGAAASSHTHAASAITSGTLPAANGGTGCTTLQATRNAMGLGNTTGALPVANGGTGSTTASAARTALGITPANIGAAAASHTHSYLPLAGGTLSSNSAQIARAGRAVSWYQGRLGAIIRSTSSGASQYTPLWSVKSQNGTWDCGTYTSDRLHFSYITDTNFDAGTNVQTANIHFGTNGSVTANSFVGALSGNASTATKLATARTVRTNLGSTATASFDGSANITPGITGTLPVANGGTGATTAANARTNLGAAASSHNHDASNITSGTLAVARGGTGQTTVQALRNSMGLGNTTAALPIANGGTGATTAAQARANLGLDQIELNFPSNADLLAYLELD